MLQRKPNNLESKLGVLWKGIRVLTLLNKPWSKSNNPQFYVSDPTRNAVVHTRPSKLPSTLIWKKSGRDFLPFISEKWNNNPKLVPLFRVLESDMKKGTCNKFLRVALSNREQFPPQRELFFLFLQRLVSFLYQYAMSQEDMAISLSWLCDVIIFW